MSEKKFTPGPWATHFVGHGESAYADILQASDTNVVIATCGPTDEELANAQLIAAAPDLYDALESCLPWLEEQSTDECADAQEGGRPNWKFNGIYNAALAALAKARGEA